MKKIYYPKDVLETIERKIAYLNNCTEEDVKFFEFCKIIDLNIEVLKGVNSLFKDITMLRTGQIIASTEEYKTKDERKVIFNETLENAFIVIDILKKINANFKINEEEFGVKKLVWDSLVHCKLGDNFNFVYDIAFYTEQLAEAVERLEEYIDYSEHKKEKALNVLDACNDIFKLDVSGEERKELLVTQKELLNEITTEEIQLEVYNFIKEKNFQKIVRSDSNARRIKMHKKNEKNNIE